jgi:hypothetical protein
MRTKQMYSVALIAMLLFNCSTLFSQNSEVKDVFAQLAGKSSGEITKNEILKDGSITCFPSDCIVTSFTFSISRRGDIIEYQTKGNKLSELIMAIIKSSDPGEKFIIESIEAEKPDATKIKLPALVFTIK